MALLYAAAKAIDAFMASQPPFPLALVLLAVLSPLLVLLHELGHALAERALGGGDIEVVVGGKGPRVEAQLGRVRMRLHGFGRTEVGAAGHARWDASRATARDVALIALAGPAASACCFVVTALLLAHVRHGAVHDVLWTATGANAIAAVLNAVPMTLINRDGRKLRSDGAIALAAIRHARPHDHAR